MAFCEELFRAATLENEADIALYERRGISTPLMIEPVVVSRSTTKEEQQIPRRMLIASSPGMTT